VSRDTKVLIGVGAIVVVGLILALTTSATIGLVVVAIGLVGAFVAMRVAPTDTDDPFADARSEADETQVGNLTPNQPLAPWSPDGGLNAWTPPVSLTGMPDAPPAAPVEPTARFEAPPDEVSQESSTAWSTEWNNDDTWQSTTSYTNEHPTSTDTNPLDELQGLDSLDPIAEVERIEARSADEPDTAEADHAFSFGGVSRPASDDVVDLHAITVNEDVAGADDIMAASQATELHLADGEQTELQKLLAKVQIRLSAYE
jgi:hypothetical protein